MRRAQFLLLTCAVALTAAALLPAVAQADTIIRKKLTVVTPRSYLVPGRNYPAMQLGDYAVDLRYRSATPGLLDSGPGWGGRLPLMQPFEMGNFRGASF